MIFVTIFVPDDNYGHPKLYDWLLVLPQEVKYIWGTPWNWTKVLYLLTRYIPFASVALMLRSELPSRWLVHLPAHHPCPVSFLDATHVTCACAPQCDLPYHVPLRVDTRSHSITYPKWAVQLSFINSSPFVQINSPWVLLHSHAARSSKPFVVGVCRSTS